MDATLATTIVSTAGSVIVGVAGMWIVNNQLGKRIDDLRSDITKHLDTLRTDIKDLRNEFYTFKDLVNSKFAALDLEIAKLMDKRP